MKNKVGTDDDLKCLICLYLKNRRDLIQEDKYRWVSIQEVQHAVYWFGGWDQADVGKSLLRLVETGDIEKSPNLCYRWVDKKEETNE